MSKRTMVLPYEFTRNYSVFRRSGNAIQLAETIMKNKENFVLSCLWWFVLSNCHERNRHQQCIMRAHPKSIEPVASNYYKEFSDVQKLTPKLLLQLLSFCFEMG
jgi:hypothetical protein